jgi:predicted Zn finger-like uncharacterized protein
MLIVCPNCATSYRVKPSSLGARRDARCAACAVATSGSRVIHLRWTPLPRPIAPTSRRSPPPIRPAAIHNGRSAHRLDALIHDVIAKPFTLATMRAAVNGALGARATI